MLIQPYKLQKIDASILSEYPILDLSDHCFFFGEYAGKLGYGHSLMNNLIFNFKKPISRKNSSDWCYKEQAIEDISKLFLLSSVWPQIKEATWVPMPPSKNKADPQYDDRLLQVLYKLKEAEKSLDIREILLARSSREASHISTRHPAKYYFDNFMVDLSLMAALPKAIIIFDDVITTGAQYKAAKTVLNSTFPNISVYGFFIARNVRKLFS